MIEITIIICYLLVVPPSGLMSTATAPVCARFSCFAHALAAKIYPPPVGPCQWHRHHCRSYNWKEPEGRRRKKIGSQCCLVAERCVLLICVPGQLGAKSNGRMLDAHLLVNGGGYVTIHYNSMATLTMDTQNQFRPNCCRRSSIWLN